MKGIGKPIVKAALNDESEHRITYEGPLIRINAAERFEVTQNGA